MRPRNYFFYIFLQKKATGNPINRINDYIWNSTYYPSSRIFLWGGVKIDFYSTFLEDNASIY